MSQAPLNPHEDEKYIVNGEGKILLTIESEDGEGGLVVEIGHPDWKPNAIVILNKAEKQDIVDQLFRYAVAGQTPHMQSTRRSK